MSPFETYVAVLKGYCAILILFIPSSYVNGGWAVSSVLFLGAGIISTVCVLFLIQVGLKLGIYSYSGIVERSLGKKARLLSEIMIALTQYSFTISHFTFETDSMKSSIDAIYGINSSKLTWSIIMLAIAIPLAWVRDIGKLSFTFMIGIFIIMFTVIVVSGYCISIISEQGGPAPGIVAWNRSEYLVTLGFVVYAFEGIGVVMPIMQTCATPDKFT